MRQTMQVVVCRVVELVGEVKILVKILVGSVFYYGVEGGEQYMCG